MQVTRTSANKSLRSWKIRQLEKFTSRFTAICLGGGKFIADCMADSTSIPASEFLLRFPSSREKNPTYPKKNIRNERS